MMKLLTRIFAVIGLILTITIIAGGISTWLWLNRPAPEIKAPENMILEIDFTSPIVEKARFIPVSIFSLIQKKQETEILDIVRAIERAREDTRVKGIIAKIGNEQISLAHIQEIRAALKKFREAGKFSYIFAPSYGSFGFGNKPYYLASIFENIWIQPVGTVGITGLGIETPFAKTALEKIGIGADFSRREEYKSVMENLTRDSFSAPVRANMESLINNITEQLVAGIAEGRKISAEKAHQWLEEGPYTAEEALEKGIVTKIGYADEMIDVATTLATEPETPKKPMLKPERVSVDEYLVYGRKKTEPKATVAHIIGTGLITDQQPGPSRFTDEHIMDTDEIVEAFADASDDPNVKAILFRIDSPGGSPEAAESIRRAIVKAKNAKKPVFVSMGDTAASGGYWIAMNADYIIAEPGTVTGSIGVVAGKFFFGELMEKLGIKWDRIETSENSRMWSPLKPFDKRGRERINSLLDATYESFTKNVAEARKIPEQKIPEIAKGRIWTGEQALKVRLVDELGGYAAAIAAIKKHLNIEPTDLISLQRFPAPETPMSLAMKILQNFLSGGFFFGGFDFFKTIKGALGNYAYDILDQSPISARIPSAFLEAISF